MFFGFLSHSAPGNILSFQVVIVQYLPVIMPLSKFTEFKIGLLQNCAKSISFTPTFWSDPISKFKEMSWGQKMLL